MPSCNVKRETGRMSQVVTVCVYILNYELTKKANEVGAEIMKNGLMELPLILKFFF